VTNPRNYSAILIASAAIAMSAYAQNSAATELELPCDDLRVPEVTAANYDRPPINIFQQAVDRRPYDPSSPLHDQDLLGGSHFDGPRSDGGSCMRLRQVKISNSKSGPASAMNANVDRRAAEGLRAARPKAADRVRGEASTEPKLAQNDRQYFIAEAPGEHISRRHDGAGENVSSYTLGRQNLRWRLDGAQSGKRDKPLDGAEYRFWSEKSGQANMDESAAPPLAWRF
jgi:hypothetical protein